MTTTDGIGVTTCRYFAIALLLALPIPWAQAQDTLVVATYVEYQGRIIELAETLIDELVGIPGAMMALDDAFLPEGNNIARLNHDDTVVRAWKWEGDDAIVIYFKEQKRFVRFHRDEVKVRTVDRPWIGPPAPPAELRPV